MQSDWRHATAGDIAASTRNALVGGPFGSNLLQRDYVTTGVPVIRGQNMAGRWVSGDFAFVSEGKADSLEANLARPGDIVFTQRGTLGQVSIVPRGPYDRYVVSQSQMKLTVDTNLADSRFFYYVFASEQQQAHFRQHAIQTGVPHINLAILRATPVQVPSLPEQRAIAHILGTLDDKIELNRQMSETLEETARALFKSWFVVFDPVRAKAEGRDPGLPQPLADLFPDGLADSELGRVPTGWNTGRFGEVIDLLREQENPLSWPDEEFDHFSIPAFDEGRQPKTECGGRIKSLKFVVPPGALLLSKLNPDIERVWLADVRGGTRAVCSTEFLVLRARVPVTRSYLYCLVRSPSFRQQIEALVTGTSKSHQRAQVEAILTLSILRPPARIIDAFDEQAAPLLERMLGCWREAQTLAALRDALLPKLISGDLRVKDAERVLGGKL